MAKATLAVIVGNRDFFPDKLVTEARSDLLALLQEMDINAVIIGENETKLGGVETWEEAKRCAALLNSLRAEIDGVLVSLPNFGDEKGVADSLKMANLHVPVLVQAYPDDLEQFNIERRRDAFCGKVSVCNNLRQYGIPFSLTRLHTVHPCSDSFKADLAQFVAVCRVVRGVRGARLGAVGARPNAFNTVRFSEKLLQASGITVATADLSEIFGQAAKIADDDPRVTAKLDEVRTYLPAPGVPSAAFQRMAKLALVLADWMDANDLNATAVQCWSSMQENYGVNACTVMSMLSDRLLPSACEVDVTGAASMYALQIASGTASALVDWNNNYGADPDKCVLFHCGNWAKTFLPEGEMQYAHVLATTLGVGSTYGAISGRVPAGPLSYARITTDDVAGRIRSYVGQGRFTDDPLTTFGARAVVEIPGLQRLMRHICKNGFEHHAAMNVSQSADVLAEAFETYLGWEVYRHEG